MVTRGGDGCESDAADNRGCDSCLDQELVVDDDIGWRRGEQVRGPG